MTDAPTTPADDPRLALEPIADAQIAQVEQLAALIERLDPVCVRLAKSAVLPAALRDPGNLLLVVLQGMSVGFSPLQSIRGAFVVVPKSDDRGGQPKVGWYTEALVALVRGSPRCRFWRVTGNHLEATVETQRTDEDRPHVVHLTMADAIAAGMNREWIRDASGTAQPREKFTWKANGAAMLSWAVQRLTCHRHYQDVMFGMPDEETIELGALDVDGRGTSSSSSGTARPVRQPPVSVSPTGQVIQDAEIVVEPVDAGGGPAPEHVDDGAGGPIPLNSDPAWLELLGLVDTWLPGSRALEWNVDDFLEEWHRRLDASTTVAALNTYAPWLGAIGDRATKSPAVRDLYQRASTAFNARSRTLKRGSR